ncbi:MAG: alpha-2-macroglobulin family protein [Chloroflexota bacterium]
MLPKQQHVRRRSAMLISLCLLLFIAACSIGPFGFGSSRAASNAGGESAMNSDIVRVNSPQLVVDSEENNDTPQGLVITLGEGAEVPDVTAPRPVTAGEALGADAIQAVLDRLPPLETDAGDQVEFRLPEQILPPPRTGDTIDEVFPPDENMAAPDAAEEGPLEVLRFAPQGEIPQAPFLNVTFNQPMVPLATLDMLSAADVPVQLEPALLGTWRWLGTKTLTFEFDDSDTAEETRIDRFPKATEYVATISAGTESATGGVLAEDVTWSFRTPPPVLTSSFPNFGPQALDTLLFVAFDQLIDAEAVLDTISVTANRTQYDIELVSEEEASENERIGSLINRSREGRWVAFKTTEPFPTDTTVVVNVGPNTPSAEGPLTTESVQSFSFQTYAPLRIEDSFCSFGGNDCPPLSPFQIIFNNPLDTDVVDASMVSISPEVPGLQIEVFGNTVRLQGQTAGRTHYEVTLDATIQDTFGQTLGKNQTVNFRTGDAPQFLTGPDDAMITLDPSSQTPAFSVYSVNFDKLNVSAYAVGPEDWRDYLTYRQNLRGQEKLPTPPGELVYSDSINTNGRTDELTETLIDLSAALPDGLGHLIVVVETPPGSLISRLFGNRTYMAVVTWVQVTQLGIEAFVDHSEMTVWVNHLQDGASVEGAEVRLYPDRATHTTDETGLVTTPLPASATQLIVASQGDDTAILSRSNYIWDDGWQRGRPRDELRWYVFDDRALYRPGERVHVKGWIRQIGAMQDADIGLATGARSMQYQVMGPRGNEIDNGTVEISALGGFNLAFDLPENSNLGYANIYFTAQGSVPDFSNFSHSFQIQEFRRPEFEVSAQIEEMGPYFVGDEAIASVSAVYFAGGPLPNAETNWSVSTSPGSYTPPNWSDFTFGIWEPWWFFRGFGFDDFGFGPEGDTSSFQTFSSVTDPSGTHYLSIGLDSLDEPRPYSIMAEATVIDVNRQAWSASTSLLVHPSRVYVGIRSERTFVEQGTPLEIEAVAVDIDGNTVSGQTLDLRAVRLEWQINNGSWGQVEEDEQTCTLTSGDEPVTCTFESTEGGEYQITASVIDNTVEDDNGGRHESQLTRWVSGGNRPTARNVEQEEASLIPDKEIYEPGDVAQILVQSPFVPAEGLLTVSRNGVLYTERFQMDESTITLEVPIEDEHIPNLNMQVDLLGESPRLNDDGDEMEGVPARPAFASGRLDLTIPPMSRTLALSVEPQDDALEPGAETAVHVTVVDADGEPVADAEIAVVVVDESVLALTAYQLADPVTNFYRNLSSGVNTTYSRERIVLANPEALADEIANQAVEVVQASAATRSLGAMGPAGAPMPLAAEAAFDMEESAVLDDSLAFAKEGGDANAQGQAIQVRSNFDPLAVFAPEVTTDADGNATVEVTLPDNLTRYRVMAVAVANENHFGMGESSITARLPLMVRPSAPRFLNFGDEFELPIVVQNQTDEDLSVDVVVQAGNIVLVGEGYPETGDIGGQMVTVPANDRVEVRFPSTTENAGTARFQIAAVSSSDAGDYADAATVDLPVYTPVTTEAFATYGVVDEGSTIQPVAAPEGVFPQFGGLEINTSSTALQALTDAVLYLTAYRFECSEQLASHILAVAALRDVLTAFDAEGLPEPEEIEAAVQRDIERLQQMQNFDGGFPIWTRGRESKPYYTIHTAHALQRAAEKGFDVPAEMQDRVRGYLRDIERFYPHWYSQEVRWSLSSYALYVRQLMGDVDTLKARQLFDEAGIEDLPIEASAWILQVLSGDAASQPQIDEIRRNFNNRVVETPSAANFTTSYGDQTYIMLHSNRRTDGIILDALIQDTPESDLIPKVVNGLLAHRNRGRWRNTQENAFILLALDRYFNTFEAETPDFVANIWLGDTYVGGHAFEGRTTERHLTEIPMNYLVDNIASGDAATEDLIVGKDGPGRLYYRLGLQYAPEDLDLDALDMGFTVQRLYEAVDDPADVTQDEDGTWRIKAGARVRVRLSMVTSNRRYNVALVDPLPAGLETINPALAVSGDIPEDPQVQDASAGGFGWWWWRTWYEHQNLRDERVEAFASLLWQGVHNYTYVARATTPGTFVVPPTKAEEMYSPEVFGRSGSDVVVVE